MCLIAYLQDHRMIIRFLLYVLLFYLIYRLIRNIFRNVLGQRHHPEPDQFEASANKRQEHRDIDKTNIEDAIFEDIDDDTK